jgi:hypothetical protein
MEANIANKRCSCNREAVKFQCNFKECPNHDSQNLYCQECLIDYKKHLHKPEKITDVKIMIEVEERWNSLNDSYAATFSKAKEKCKPFKQLIAFLGEISSESETIKPTKAIHEDYATLAQYASEFPKHMASLSELLIEKDVEGLKNFDAAAPAYTEALPRFGYLESLTESGLFEAYRAALLHDTEKCFPADFTQENRERYYRLKFRALNAARSQDKNDQQKVNLSLLALQKSTT